ncbi:hypothetical protein GQX74_014252 [Glossina fuscipes]|nr:hypothetical protein GQX74_014252 [Glossina fuscipes]
MENNSTKNNCFNINKNNKFKMNMKCRETLSKSIIRTLLEILQFEAKSAHFSADSWYTNFSFEPLHLISGSLGPLRTGMPMHVPLRFITKHQKCEFVPFNTTFNNRLVLEHSRKQKYFILCTTIAIRTDLLLVTVI